MEKEAYKPMDHLKSILSQITYLFDIGIFLYFPNELCSFSEDMDGNPLKKSAELKRILMDKAKFQEIPIIYKDCFGICFCCIKTC
jgi:hypothetical protein